MSRRFVWLCLVGCGSNVSSTDGPLTDAAIDGLSAPDVSSESLDTARPDTNTDDSQTDSPSDSALRVTRAVPFDVWAPHAARMWVVGTFNNWSETADELTRQGDQFVGQIQAASGDEYQFVIETSAGERIWRRDPRSMQLTNSVGNSVVVDHDVYTWRSGSFQTPVWDDWVIHEMHVGTFSDQPGDQPGTFRSAAARLDALAELGVSAIHVMPVGEFAGDFSWGYNSAYPFAPESAYGTPDDFKYFIDEAHLRGIAVILDVVHNHYGPSDLSMWCFDGECLGAGGVYFYTDARGQTDWGPRPDFGRQEVRDFIQDNTAMWLSEYRLDGMRWDSTVNIRRASTGDLAEGWQVLQGNNGWVNDNQPWKLMIAEDLQNDDWITRDIGAGGAGFDAQWDGRYFHPINRTIIEQSDNLRNMFDVRDAITASYGRPSSRVIYTESHDEVANGRQRIPEMIWPGNAASEFSKRRSTLGAAITMTSPGVPMIFQGQEFLEDGYFQDTDPLDWSRAETFSGIRAMYRDLIALRRNRSGATRGLRGNNVNVFHVNNTDKVIAFHRYDVGGVGDDVVVVANFSSRTFEDYQIGLPRGGAWYLHFNSDSSLYDSSFGATAVGQLDATQGSRDGLGFQGATSIGPYSVLIFSQQP